MQERMVEVRMIKCTLILTEAEVISLLAHDKDLWQRAIRRGKVERRTRSTERREQTRDRV